MTIDDLRPWLGLGIVVLFVISKMPDMATIKKFVVAIFEFFAKGKEGKEEKEENVDDDEESEDDDLDWVDPVNYYYKLLAELVKNDKTDAVAAMKEVVWPALGAINYEDEKEK